MQNCAGQSNLTSPDFKLLNLCICRDSRGVVGNTLASLGFCLAVCGSYNKVTIFKNFLKWSKAMHILLGNHRQLFLQSAKKKFFFFNKNCNH